MAGAATATATEKPYRALLELLADKDHVGVQELPQAMQELRTLNLAWIEGVIEFGRINHSETGVVSADAVCREKHTIIEGTYNWTGHKRTMHKQLKDVLAEDKPEAMPTNCVEATEEINPTTKAVSVKYKKVGNDRLKLRVRITDKGFAYLAS